MKNWTTRFTLLSEKRIGYDWHWFWAWLSSFPKQNTLNSALGSRILAQTCINFSVSAGILKLHFCLRSCYLGYDLDVFIIEYGDGPVVSMGWHGSCVSVHGAAMHWIRYAFSEQIRVQTRQSSAKILSRRLSFTIFMLVPNPICNAIFAGSFDVPAEIYFFFQFVM